MKRILVTGGTGLIGKALVEELLKQGYAVIILSRNPEKYVSDNSMKSFAKWDIEKQVIDLDAIRNADMIIHLAGASVAEKRWTEKRKKEIFDSRVLGGEFLYKILSENENKVQAFFCASAIGWYGEQANQSIKAFIETDPPADDFLGETCRRWEEVNGKLAGLNKRTVIFRIGILLANEGGFLKEFQKPIRFGIAPILGNGKQIVSWIHIDDLVRLFLYAIKNENISGIYNAVSNEPTSMKQIVLQYAEKLRGRFFVPIFVPSFFIKIILGEMSTEILKSVTVNNAKIKREGFGFLYPHISSAIDSMPH